MCQEEMNKDEAARQNDCARETMRLEIESRSRNEEFARVALAP